MAFAQTCYWRNFPMQIWGQILALFPNESWAKTSRNDELYFQSPFWWLIHENHAKNRKGTDSHLDANIQCTWNATRKVLMKLFGLFTQNKYTQILLTQVFFSKIQQAPGQNFGKVGKSLHCIFNTLSAQYWCRESAVHTLRAPWKHCESVVRAQRIALRTL